MIRPLDDDRRENNGVCDNAAVLSPPRDGTGTYFDRLRLGKRRSPEKKSR